MKAKELHIDSDLVFQSGKHGFKIVSENGTVNIAIADWDTFSLISKTDSFGVKVIKQLKKASEFTDQTIVLSVEGEEIAHLHHGKLSIKKYMKAVKSLFMLLKN